MEILFFGCKTQLLESEVLPPSYYKLFWNDRSDGVLFSINNELIYHLNDVPECCAVC